MPGSAPSLGLNRRALLERAIVLVGGAAALSLGACARTGPFFSSERMAILDAVTDIIIPETDTPGARGAGVPAFIDSMMTNWASDETQQKYNRVIDAFDERARAAHNTRFVALTPEQQLETVRAHDAENIHAEDESYRQFKQLVLVGYYHSEIGATQELHYELVPGAWRADVPLSEIGKAWA